MPATQIDFQHLLVPTASITHVVYTRTAWTEEWEEQPNLHCESATWAAAPEIDTAVLRWRYGTGQQPGDSLFAEVTRMEIRGFYVKIVFSHEDSALSNEWYGICEVTADHMGGKYDGIEQGVQRLQCYGLGLILDRHVIRDSVYHEGNLDLAFKLGYAIPFNERGFANRKKDKGSTNGVNYSCYTFIDHDESGNFATKYAKFKYYWSTHDIVEYLLEVQTPTDVANDLQIRFRLDAISTFHLPTADRPTLFQHGRTTWQLLNALISRHRLLSFRLRVDADDYVVLTPFSFNAEDIDLPGSETTINANGDQKLYGFDDDASARPVLTITSLDTFDRVVVEGARVRCCFTASHQDATLANGWPASLKTTYDSGANMTGLGAGDITERRRRHAEFRSRDELRPVYARFELDMWSVYKAGNGLGTGTMRPIDPYNENDPTNALSSHYFYQPTIHILPSLPLLDGHDYSGSKILNGTVTTTSEGPFNELPPMGFAPLLEDSSRYVQLDNIGVAMDMENTGGKTVDTDRTWSCGITVPSRDRAVIVRVYGAPQYMIAKDTFAGTTEDYTPLWDFEDFVYTIAIEGHRHVAATESVADILVGDYERTMLIDAGDEYRLDYVVPDTIVGVDDKGQLVRSNGGYVRDDRSQLQDLAKLALEWYSVERATLEFSTHVFVPMGPVTGTQVGDLVTQLTSGSYGVELNTVVTSISIDTPISDGHIAPPAIVTYRTGFASLDVLKL